MGTFQIEGGHKLKGEITPQGAKNEALQILCAVLLTPEKVIIENIPDILDVNKLIKILENLGVKIQKLGKGKFAFTADDLNLDYLESELLTPSITKRLEPTPEILAPMAFNILQSC